MRNSISIKIGGPAGAGIKSVGMLIAKTLSRSGFSVFEYPEYPSLIRGGHNTEQIFASSQPTYSQTRPVDILLAMDQKTVDLDSDELSDTAAVIYDPHVTTIDKKLPKKQYIEIPLKELALKHGSEIMANNVGVGAILKLIDIPTKHAKDLIAQEFSDKKKDIINANCSALERGYSAVSNANFKLEIPKKKVDQVVMTGNDAVALGAIASGIGLYVSYPMTPSSSVLHTLAIHQHEYNYVIRQPEDEIAAANMVLGSMFTGVRAMTGTSGGGFALMNETISLSGISEIPMVVFVAQRPGPATGMPTWTEQGDLLHIIHAGHGEFMKIVLAPGDLEEAFLLTAEAFNLAERYQAPVIILSDKYLGESAMSTMPFYLSHISIDRGTIVTPEKLKKLKNFQRYAVTASGISGRSLPGSEGGIFLANSYEHEYHGYDEESSQIRIWQNEKRMKKLETALENLPGPVCIGPEKSDVTIVTWGSMKLPAQQAIAMVGRTKKVNIIHFTYVWPLNKKAVQKSIKEHCGKQTLMIENNSTGQFQTILKQEAGFEPTACLRRYDGRPIYPEEIIKALSEL